MSMHLDLAPLGLLVHPVLIPPSPQPRTLVMTIQQRQCSVADGRRQEATTTVRDVRDVFIMVDDSGCYEGLLPPNAGEKCSRMPAFVEVRTKWMGDQSNSLEAHTQEPIIAGGGGSSDRRRSTIAAAVQQDIGSGIDGAGCFLSAGGAGVVHECRSCFFLTAAPHPCPPLANPSPLFTIDDKPVCSAAPMREEEVETDDATPFEVSTMVDSRSCYERLLPEMLVRRVAEHRLVVGVGG